MPSLPEHDGKNVIAPHTVILGAGASIAMTRLNAEKFGKELPSMDNLVEKIELAPLLDKHGNRNHIPHKGLHVGCRPSFEL